MLLTSKGRYAVMAMMDLNQQNQQTPIPLAAIAARQELPLPYLEQLFLKLRKAGLVRSVRGANGGYILAYAADDIRILDIIMAVDKPLQATRCKIHSTAGCLAQGKRCATHDLWHALGMVVREFLMRVTLADVHHKRLTGVG